MGSSLRNRRASGNTFYAMASLTPAATGVAISTIPSWVVPMPGNTGIAITPAGTLTVT